MSPINSALHNFQGNRLQHCYFTVCIWNKWCSTHYTA